MVKNVPLRNFNSWQQSSKWYHLFSWKVSFNYQVSFHCNLLNVWFQCLFSFIWRGPCVKPQLFSLHCRQSDSLSAFITRVASSFPSELAETWIGKTSQALAFPLCSTDTLCNQVVRLGGVGCDKYLATRLDQLIPTGQTHKCENAAGWMIHSGLEQQPPGFVGLWLRPWAPSRLSDTPSAEHLEKKVGDLN